jgi:hypothetical protein
MKAYVVLIDLISSTPFKFARLYSRLPPNIGGEIPESGPYKLIPVIVSCQNRLVYGVLRLHLLKMSYHMSYMQGESKGHRFLDRTGNWLPVL